MVRTQIQLPEAQYRRLKAIAHERGISLAALIRELLDAGLCGGAVDRDAPYERATSLVGAFHARERDLSSHHDEHLESDFA